MLSKVFYSLRKFLIIYGIRSTYTYEVFETAKNLGYKCYFFDNLNFKFFKELNDNEIFLKDRKINNFSYVSGLSSPSARKISLSEIDESKIIKLIDKTSKISSNTKIEPGVYINSFVNIGTNTYISFGSNINRSSNIGHDVKIGKYSHIGPGSTICGSVNIEENVFIGAGAVICPELKIGKNSVIGAGSIVTKSIPEDVVVFGNPAKIRLKT